MLLKSADEKHAAKKGIILLHGMNIITHPVETLN
jgi:hypothetical protein